MAFDYGTKRIGVAVGQGVSRTATALRIVAAKAGQPQWHEMTKLIDEWLPALFVVGYPTYEDGRRHPLSDEIERFSRRLSGRYNRPVEFADERLSSFEASRNSAAQDRGLDAEAARIILLSWFEQAFLQKSLAN